MALLTEKNRNMDLKNFIGQIKNLPPAPQVLTKLTHLINNLNASIDEVVSILRVDASLTATVVRLSNSAFYGISSSVSSPEEAVNRVGFKEVCKLIGMINSRELFKMPMTTYRLKPGELWKTSICCAIAMERFARRSHADPDTAYTLGLLHAVGKLAINQYLAGNKELISFAPTGDNTALVEWEREQSGFDHAEAGGKLLESWNFSPDVYGPVRHQLSPLEAPGEKRMACLLHLSTCTATHIASNGSMEKEGEGIFASEAILEEVGISIQDLNECLPDIRQGMKEVLDLLKEG